MLYFLPVIFFALLSLGGCQNSQPIEYRSCLSPATSIIHELARQSFRDETLKHEVARLEIESFTEFPQKSDKEAELNFRIVFSALRKTTQAKLNGNFFIAITDQKENPLLKKIFPLEIIFEGKKKFQRKITEVTIPVPLKLMDQCEKYKVFIGFDLRGEELERNLRRLEQKTS